MHSPLDLLHLSGYVSKLYPKTLSVLLVEDFLVTYSSSFVHDHDCRRDGSQESACFSSDTSGSHTIFSGVANGRCCETAGQDEGLWPQLRVFSVTQQTSLIETQTQKLTLPSVTLSGQDCKSVTSWPSHLELIL